MIALGAALEGGQVWAPGRHVELGDLMANTLGVFVGILVGLYWR